MCNRSELDFKVYKVDRSFLASRILQLLIFENNKTQNSLISITLVAKKSLLLRYGYGSRLPSIAVMDSESQLLNDAEL